MGHRGQHGERRTCRSIRDHDHLRENLAPAQRATAASARAARGLPGRPPGPVRRTRTATSVMRRGFAAASAIDGERERPAASSSHKLARACSRSADAIPTVERLHAASGRPAASSPAVTVSASSTRLSAGLRRTSLAMPPTTFDRTRESPKDRLEATFLFCGVACCRPRSAASRIERRYCGHGDREEEEEGPRQRVTSHARSRSASLPLSAPAAGRAPGDDHERHPPARVRLEESIELRWQRGRRALPR